MKVLIAGATGAIGRPIVKLLKARGHDVQAVMRSPLGSGPALDVVPVVADALDRDALLRAVDGLRFDVVIHELTALRQAPAKFADMDATNELRITGTANLLAAAREVGATRFLTQSMVPGYGYVDHGGQPLTEADPFGRSRGGRIDRVVEAMLAAEQQAFDAPGIDGIALRYGAFYGPGATESVVEAMHSGKLAIPKNGGGTMAWIHVEDAAAATVAAMEKGIDGEAYNVVDDTPATWGEMFAEVSRVFGVGPVRRMPAWMIKRMAPYFATLMIGTSMRVSNSKAKRELGWTPAYPSLREGLTHMGTPSHGSIIEHHAS